MSEPTCPKCARVIDATWNVDGLAVRPSVGDLAVCAYCSTILTFVNPLPSVRQITDAELRALEPEERDWLHEALSLSRAARRGLGRETSA